MGHWLQVRPRPGPTEVRRGDGQVPDHEGERIGSIRVVTERRRPTGHDRRRRHGHRGTAPGDRRARADRRGRCGDRRAGRPARDLRDRRSRSTSTLTRRRSPCPTARPAPTWSSSPETARPIRRASTPPTRTASLDRLVELGRLPVWGFEGTASAVPGPAARRRSWRPHRRPAAGPHRGDRRHRSALGGRPALGPRRPPSTATRTRPGSATGDRSPRRCWSWRGTARSPSTRSGSTSSTAVGHRLGSAPVRVTVDGERRTSGCSTRAGWSRSRRHHRRAHRSRSRSTPSGRARPPGGHRRGRGAGAARPPRERRTDRPRSTCRAATAPRSPLDGEPPSPPGRDHRRRPARRAPDPWAACEPVDLEDRVHRITGSDGDDGDDLDGLLRIDRLWAATADRSRADPPTSVEGGAPSR